MTAATIAAIYVYPVKSMRGIALERGRLTEKGLEHDRRWMVVRENGRFVTQRDMPALARVQTALDDAGVTLSAEGHDSIAIPFDSKGGESVLTHVWKDECAALDEGPGVSRWISDALGSDEPLRLVRMAPAFRRTLGESDRFGAGTTTHFADSAPYLVANEASLEQINLELQARGLDAVPMNRFRPNIVLRGPGPFAEHRLKDLAGDGWHIKLMDACERCLVTTVDQETGQRDPERQPYMAMREIHPIAGPGTAPAFAQNATLAAGNGLTIRVGDSLKAS
ncbi:MAG: MOSC N-terminal beta barrel domain-containing protein [Planctomycetes bacterium]|nr:MOSC N-terminal beta barrel domain-containing protein [Planctomycetota bacterium]